jgi:ABC-type bacteriocin/lantibiotic exporter with double-glycine peptidase domain
MQLCGLLTFSIIGAGAELATLGALIPFLSVLANPTKVISYPLVDSILPASVAGNQKNIVILATLIFGTIILLAAVIRLILSWATVKFTQGLGYELGIRAYTQTLHKPYQYHLTQNTSDIIAGLAKVDTVILGILTPLMNALIAIIMIAAILIGLAFINWRVALLTMALLSALYVILIIYSKNQVSQNSKIISSFASLKVQALQEGLGGVRDIILDGSQKFHVERFSAYDALSRRAYTQITLWGQMPRYIVEALGVGIISAFAVFLAIRSGGIGGTIPTLGALALGAQKLLPLFQQVYAGYNSLFGNVGNLEDVARLAGPFSYTDSFNRTVESNITLENEICLSNVGFRYNDDSPWILKNITVVLKKGSRLGIVGRTGGGKSTFLDIVMGLIEVCEGTVSVDGEVLKSNNIRQWQKKIAHVPQHIFLRDASIAENIALGQPHERIDISRMERAAKLALIDGFIEELPEKYMTKVGERGVRLSGGQRQRIGIARALYRESEVLVLDEATSALDEKTEAKVMENIHRLHPDLTILIVAHRLSTLAACDAILDIEKVKETQQASSIQPQQRITN